MRRLQPVVVNKTSYRGDDLRRFALVGLRARGAQGLIATVEFRISPGFRESGWAFTDEAKILVLLPRGFNSRSKGELKSLAQVFTHEIDHILGLEHREMERFLDLNVTWQEGLQIRRRQASHVKPILDSFERRIRALTLAMDDAWFEEREVNRHTAKVKQNSRRRRK